MQQSAPLTEQEIAQLENWLASPAFHGRAMTLDRLQGFLAAIISAPDQIAPAIWLPQALGRIRPDSMEEAQTPMELLKRFYNEIAENLCAQRPLKLLLKPQKGNGEAFDYQPWCEGYIAGWSLSQEEWLRPGNEALKKLTFPILLLSGAFREAAEREGVEYVPDASQLALQQECMDMLPQAVADIYGFWVERRSAPATPLRRQTSKVGRNELCPCGSGKKFKQCCGANRTLH